MMLCGFDRTYEEILGILLDRRGTQLSSRPMGDKQYPRGSLRNHIASWGLISGAKPVFELI